MELATWFEGLMGHQALKEKWLHLLHSGHLPHAMLFAGSEGLGKTTAAFALASALCGRPVMTGLEPASQTLMEQDRDEVYYLRPTGKLLKVEQFRALQEELQMTGREDGTRICIIDEAQTMNKEFANRMLKTLEEPPEQVYFILITSQEKRMLPTILSRCAVFRFLPVPAPELTAELCRVKGWEESACEQAVLLGGGNVRRTLELYETGQVEGVQDALEFLRLLAESRTPYTSWYQTMEKEGFLSSAVLRWIVQLCRDMLVLRAGAVQAVGLKKYQAAMVQLLPVWTNRALLQMIQAAEEAMEALERHVNQKLVWDYLCIEGKRSIKEGYPC